MPRKLIALARRSLLATMLFQAVAMLPRLARAQAPENGLPQPRLSLLQPAGGQIGTTVEVLLVGTDLDAPTALLFSHPALKAELVPPPSAAAAPKDAPPQPAGPRFRITLPPGTPVGQHDVRFVGKYGVSNPRTFVVGVLPEFNETEPNNDVPQAQRLPLNATVNGAISAPTDVDYFLVAAKRGQRIVIHCSTAGIDSRLTAAVQVFDGAGRLVSHARARPNSDTVFDWVPREDGDLILRLYDFGHTQGGPEHFYRLTLSNAPWIDAVFPSVVEPGKPTPVTVYGRNLPGGTLEPAARGDGQVVEKTTLVVVPPNDARTADMLMFSGQIPPSSAALDGFELRVSNTFGPSNPMLMTLASAPVVLDQGANDTAESAQTIPVPCEIAGHVESPRDRDWYAFTARKGDTYVLDVQGERLGAPVDLFFALLRAENKQELFGADDTTDTLTAARFVTRTSDPAPYRFVAPADGRYLLLVSSHDADHRGNVALHYRARLVPERPDFRLIALPPSESRPDALCLPAGGQEAFTILVWRQDGWNDGLTLTAEGLPPGVTCRPQAVAPGQKQATLVLSAAADAPPGAGVIRILGTATIQGQTVIREARPAGLIWPTQAGQNFPASARLERNLVLAVRDPAPFNLSATLDQAGATPTGKVTVTLQVTRNWPDAKVPVSVTLYQPLTGLTLNNNQPVQIPADKNEVTAALEVRGGALPGAYSLVFRGVAQVPFTREPAGKNKTNIAVVFPSFPVSFTVVPAQVVNVVLPKPAVDLKPGTQAEVVVKLTRVNGYKGDLKIQLVVPAAVKGISAAEVMVPPEQHEARLQVRAAADATPGARNELVLRVTAVTLEKVSVVKEEKLTVNIVK